MMRGHIVENTVCRVLRESPILVAPDADWQILETPLDADERPDRENSDRYLAPNLAIRESLDDLQDCNDKRGSRGFLQLPFRAG